MKKIEKILCRKSYEKSYDLQGEKISFEKGKLYDCYLWGYYVDYYAYVLFESEKGLFFDKNEYKWYGPGNTSAHAKFEEHFYSPEETKNISRTKLIDKILDETI